MPSITARPSLQSSSSSPVSHQILLDAANAAVQFEKDAKDAKSRFLAVASHGSFFSLRRHFSSVFSQPSPTEMRTPLHAILGWSEILQKRNTLGEEDGKIVEVRIVSPVFLSKNI